MTKAIKVKLVLLACVLLSGWGCDDAGDTAPKVLSKDVACYQKPLVQIDACFFQLEQDKKVTCPAVYKCINDSVNSLPQLCDDYGFNWQEYCFEQCSSYATKDPETCFTE